MKLHGGTIFSRSSDGHGPSKALIRVRSPPPLLYAPSLQVHALVSIAGLSERLEATLHRTPLKPTTFFPFAPDIQRKQFNYSLCHVSYYSKKLFCVGLLSLLYSLYLIVRAYIIFPKIPTRILQFYDLQHMCVLCATPRFQSQCLSSQFVVPIFWIFYRMRS